MFEYAVVFLLILNAISLLHLQYYCFQMRKTFPSISEVAESKSHTLLSTVDEGVQILADLADIIESGGMSGGSQNTPPNSPIAALLTNLLISNTPSNAEQWPEEIPEDNSPAESLQDEERSQPTS